MAGQIKIYSDSNCTTELTGGAPYTLQIGPTTGLNGTDGEVYTTSVWVKNTGDVAISNVTLTELSDSPNRGSYSINDSSYESSVLVLSSSLAVNAVVRVYIRVTVAALSSPAVNVALNFKTEGTYLV